MTGAIFTFIVLLIGMIIEVCVGRSGIILPLTAWNIMFAANLLNRKIIFMVAVAAGITIDIFFSRSFMISSLLIPLAALISSLMPDSIRKQRQLHAVICGGLFGVFHTLSMLVISVTYLNSESFLGQSLIELPANIFFGALAMLAVTAVLNLIVDRVGGTSRQNGGTIVLVKNNMTQDETMRRNER